MQKVTEEKFFQHLDKERLGQVTKLVAIEEDVDMTLFHFADGTKCNVEFCSPLNDTKAFENHQIMAEVSDPQNIWTFQDKVVIPKTKKGIDRDGQEWEIPDPYLDPKGEKGPHQEVTKKIGIPPSVVRRSNLSKFGIESEPQKPTIAVAQPAPEQVEQLRKDVDTVAKSLKEHLPGIVSSLSAGNATINKPNPGEPVFINISPIQGGTWSVQVDQIDKIGLIKGSEQYVGYTEELFNHLKSEQNPPIEQGEPEDPGTKTFSENDPVFILIDKCKKKEGICNLEIKAQLPGKSIYTLIQEEYDEADSEKFFDIIIDQLDVNEIKKAIKESLKAAYSSSTQQ